MPAIQDVVNKVFAIFLFNEGPPTQIVEFRGTGFFVGPNGLFMTVMHVLDREPRKGEYYGIIIEEPYESDKFKYYRIEHFEKEPNGLDLVIGTIDCSNTSYFPICRNKSTFGAEVYTYGFQELKGRESLTALGNGV
jgi:hypothetical protein